jgi:hypothetical protein
MNQYPSCVGKMPPGTPFMSLAKLLEKGSGKVYQPYSGVVNLTKEARP